MARQHFLALDGLRGIAAIAVVIYHRRWFGPGGHAFDHGFLAVNFFFILSGFVIDHAYRGRLSERMTLGAFAKSRAIRLYPLIVAGAALGLLYACLLARMNHEVGATIRYIKAAVFTALCLPAPASLVPMPFFINRPTWSLFFELVANAGYALLLFRLSTKALIALCAVILPSLVYAAFHLGTLNAGFEYADIWWGLPVVFVPFTIGVILNRVAGRISVPALPFWASASIMILLFQPHELPGAWEPVYQLALMFFGFPMIILASLRADPQGRWGGATKWLGDISYPLYALHYPILLLVGGVAKLAHVPDIITLAVGTIVSVMAAWIAFKFYDEPVRRWLSNRLIRRPIAPASDHATVAGSVKVSVAAS